MTEVIGDITFKEKPDIAQVFIRQLDRTNQAASVSPEIHQASVYQTLANLPTRWRNWVYGQEDRYKTTGPTLMYKKYAGRRLGTPNAPLLKNPKIPVKRLEDGSIDWNDPNIRSPLLQERTETDYQKFNEVVMEAAEFAGLTWNVDEMEVDAGDTEEYIERRKTPWRPLDESTEEEEEGLQDTERER